MWGFFTLSMIGVCASIVLLIRRFADKNVELVIRFATAYGWLTAMMVIALVPLDAWAAYTMAGPSVTNPILILWNVAYWSTQIATWFVLPFYQVYAEAGDFSVKNKCWTSLKENVVLYGTIGVLGLIGIIIVVFSTGMNSQEGIMDLIGLGVFASNAFGLVVGLLLMGYGLVEIPRSMWITSRPETMLKWCAHRVGKFAEEVMRSTHELETVVTIIYANQKQMRRTDPLRPFMDIITEQAEQESPIKPSELAQRNVDIEGLKAEDLEYNYDKKGLSKLRRRQMSAVADYQAARAQYGQVMLEAFELEDIVKCRQLVDYTPPPVRLGEGGAQLRAAKPWTKHVWHYKCVVRPYANKVFSVLLVCLGGCIVWSEIVIPVYDQDLSPFSLIIRGTEGAFVFQLLTVFPLVYMCVCSYFALFKITAFNYNRLVVGATTGAGLMQNGSLMCRFAAPTCWNFYHIIRFAKDYCTGNCQLTCFSVIMASMADVSTFKYIKINIYLPILLVIHCVMVAFGIWEKLLNMCRSSRFQFSTDDYDDEYTEKGRLLIRKEQEATSQGAKVGEVLHSAYFDLEFPTIAGVGRGAKKKGGLFGGFFKKKPSPTDAPTPLVAPAASNRPQSAAVMAASRWIKPAGSDTSPGLGPIASSPALTGPGPGHDNPMTSLLSARQYEQGSSAAVSGPSASSQGAAGGGPKKSAPSGLDSLFADLGTRLGGAGGGGGSKAGVPPGPGGMSGPSRLGMSSAPFGAGPAPSAPSAMAAAPTRLMFGAPLVSGSSVAPAAPAAKGNDSDSLMGLWGTRS